MRILTRHSILIVAALVAFINLYSSLARADTPSVSFTTYDSCMAAFQSAKALMAQLQDQIKSLESQLVVLAPTKDKNEVPYEALINAPNHKLKNETRRDWLVRHLAWRSMSVEDLSQVRGIGVVKINELKEFVSGARREPELHAGVIDRISIYFYANRTSDWSNVGPTIWAMRDIRLLPVEMDTTHALEKNSMFKVVDLLKYDEETICRMVTARTEPGVKQIDDLAIVSAMHQRMRRARDAGEFAFSSDAP